MPTPRPGQPGRYEIHPYDGMPAAGGGRKPGQVVDRASLPGVSGRGSALILAGLLLLTALVVPLAVHRALWINAEAVLLVWFGIWTVALGWLGYHGRGVERDWGAYEPLWNIDGSSGGRGRSWGDGIPALDLGSADLGEGCLGIIVGLMVLVAVVLVVGWLVPLVAVGLYATMHALLDRVGRRAAETRGDLGAALVRAVAWSAAYTVPLALAVLALHVAR